MMPSALQLAAQPLAAHLALGLGPAQHAPGAVAAGAEGLRHALRRARQDVRRGAHAAGHQHRLAHVAIVGRAHPGGRGRRPAWRPCDARTPSSPGRPPDAFPPWPCCGPRRTPGAGPSPPPCRQAPLRTPRGRDGSAPGGWPRRSWRRSSWPPDSPALPASPAARRRAGGRAAR